MEDGDDSLWDQRSDFSKLGHAGYRNGILGSGFEEAETEGRVMGFHQASKVSLNPTVFLSRLDGLLVACLVKLSDSLSDEQRREAHMIRAEITKVTNLAFKPTPEIVQKYSNSNFCQSRGNEKVTESEVCDEKKACDCDSKQCQKGKGNASTLESQYKNICERTTVFCTGVGWKIPDFIGSEMSTVQEVT